MVELSMVDQSNKLLNDEIYNKVKVICIFLVYIDILTEVISVAPGTRISTGSGSTISVPVGSGDVRV